MKTFVSFLILSLLVAAHCAADIQVIGALARTKSAKPGESFEGVIQLKNTGSSTSQVKVRQTDYHFAADGSNRYDEPGSSPRSNADWLSVTPPRVVLEPNQTAQVHYRCKVPVRSDLKGAYWSMIMIEPVASPATPSKGEGNQAAMGLQAMIRFGVQIVTDTGNGTRAIKIQDKKLLQDPSGSQKLQLDIANTGERALHPSVSVELYNDKGASVGRFDAGKARLYPTCSIRATATLTGVAPGKYTALVLVDSGDANVMGAQYSLEIGS